MAVSEVLGFTFLQGFNAFLVWYTLVMVNKRKRHEAIIKRIPNILSSITFNYLFFGFVCGIDFPFWPSITSKIPCFARLCLLYFSVPLIIGLHLCRFTMFTISYILSTARTNRNYEIRKEEVYLLKMAKFLHVIAKIGCSEKVKNAYKTQYSSIKTVDKIALESTDIKVLMTKDLTKQGPSRGSSIPSSVSTGFVRELEDIKQLNGRDILGISAFIVTISMILYVIICFVSPIRMWDITKSTDCWNFQDLVGLYLIVACGLTMLLFVVYVLRRIDDTLLIRKEATVGTISMLISLGSFILVLHAPFPPFNILYKYVSQFFVTYLFGFLAPVVVFGLHPLYLSYKFEKSGSKLMGFDLESFIATLKDKSKFQILKEEAAKSFSLENIMFYEELKRFYALQGYDLVMAGHVIEENNNINFNDATTDILKKYTQLYEGYLKPGARNELNVPSAVRDPLSEALKTKKVKLDAMEPVKNEVLKMLYVNTFPRFLKRQAMSASDPV
jgi:hypothetical protein